MGEKRRLRVKTTRFDEKKRPIVVFEATGRSVKSVLMRIRGAQDTKVITPEEARDCGQQLVAQTTEARTA